MTHLSMIRRLHGLAGVCMLAMACPGHAEFSPFAEPPQHRATRSDPADRTPMKVVPSDATRPDLGQGWYWVPIDGAKCRDGSSTGVAVRLRPYSRQVFVSLLGGGACYSFASCATNPASFGLDDFQLATITWDTLGIRLFDGIWQVSGASGPGAASTRRRNVLADQSTQVVIPYCSGDMHVGARDNAEIPWVGKQRFQGARNTELYYRYIVEQLMPRHMAMPADVVLTGLSAGGYGATLTAHKLRDMLPPQVKMTLIIDSAPLFKQTTTEPIPPGHVKAQGTVGSPHETLYRSCLQQRFHDAWGLAGTVIKDCGAGCKASNWMNPTFEKLLVEKQDVFVGLISPTYDSVLRNFMSTMLQEGNCGHNPTEGQYLEGLMNLRRQMQTARAGRGNHATYFVSVDKTRHVLLHNEHYYSLNQPTAAVPTQPAVRLQDWFEGVIFRKADDDMPITPAHVGP